MISKIKKLLFSKRFLFIAPFALTFPISIFTLFLLSYSLSALEYGLFSLAMSAITLFSSVNSLGLGTAILKYPHVLTYRPIFILKMLLIGGSGATLGLIGFLYYSSALHNIYLYVVFAGFFQAAINASNGYYRGLNKPFLFAESLLLQKILFLICILFLDNISIKQVLFIYCFVFFPSVFLLVLEVRRESRKKPVDFFTEDIKKIFKLGRALTLANVLVFFMPFWDRFLISTYYADDLGIYSFNSDVVVKITAFWLIWLKLITFPELVRDKETSLRKKYKYIDKVLAIVSISYILIVLFISIFYDLYISNFSKYGDISIFIILASAGLIQCLSYINSMKVLLLDKPLLITLSSCITIVIHLVFSYLVVQYGGMAVAFSFVVSSLVSYVVISMISKRLIYKQVGMGVMSDS